MIKRALSPDEVKKRLLRLRNLVHLHYQQKLRNQALWEENQRLKQRVLLLEETVTGQQKIIEDLKLQIEELRIMVFGQKKPKVSINNDDRDRPSPAKVQRSDDSYKRPLPKDNEVTEVQYHSLNRCLCGAVLKKKHIISFYEEDIPIPVKKVVRKHEVETGYCPKCQQQQSALPVPTSKVILGPNVQKYVCYLNVFCRLSFSQIQQLLFDTYRFELSQGEIAKILSREALRLRPFYERLKEQIRAEPIVHLDETGWCLFIDGGPKPYAWVMSGALSQESVFTVGESRGKGNAENLLGQDFSGVVVSDDYGAYRKLEKHQLCWAHLLRKFRDLARATELNESQKNHCQQEYAKLCGIYENLLSDRNPARYEELCHSLLTLAAVKATEPKKLIRLKTTLKQNVPQYLICLTDPRVPLTNNQAERALRHLVIKRKVSFGSFSKKTAETLAVLLSVIMSLRQRHQANFFGEYLKV